MNVKAVGGHVAKILSLRNQGRSPVFRHAVQQRVINIALLIGEIKPGDAMDPRSPGEKAHIDVGCLSAGDYPRLDRFEPEVLVTGFRPSETTKGFVGQRLVGVGGVVEVSLRIGLPDFNAGKGDRLAIAVEYPALNVGALARGFILHQYIFSTPNHANTKKGASSLSGCLLEHLKPP